MWGIFGGGQHQGSGQPVVALAITVFIVLGSLVGCGDENFTESQIRLEVENERNETVYWIKGTPADDRSKLVAGPFNPIPPGTSSTIGVGGVELDPGAGGCFENEQLWFVVSVSGARFDVADPTDAGDVIVIDHLRPDTCFDTSDVIWPLS